MKRKASGHQPAKATWNPRPPAWALSLPDYLGPFRVETEEGEGDRALIARTTVRILTAPREEFEEVIHPWRSDLRFLIRERQRHEFLGTILVEDVATGSRIGGALCGLPIVIPAFRGGGIGAEMACLSDGRDRFALRPARYSLEGFRARRTAHRLQVGRALELAPETVTRAALDWYARAPDGRLVLAREWGADEQNAHIRPTSRK